MIMRCQNIRKNLALAAMGISVVGCASNPMDGITGKWLIHKVIQNGQDVTAERDPHGERYLVLKSDSSFESGGRPFGENTGKYSINTEDNNLFLDSDLGPEDDSYWMVRINNDTMYWQGFGSEWAENFQIIQIREKAKWSDDGFSTMHDSCTDIFTNEQCTS